MLQMENGSFRGTLGDCESDMRFLYCACAISAMLGDWSGVDKDRAVQYVLSCLTYEGGISLIPG
jgi:geranylgeranyl transferase type-1 subunit beta